jgi:plastocyanin
VIDRVVSLHGLALACGMALIAVPQAQTPATGTIAGHVALTAHIRARLPSSAYPTRRVGTHAPPPIPEIQNVVVYLKMHDFHGTLPVMRAELHQENETFVPHVVAITKGSSVTFPNDDPYFHNVFSLSSAGSFNLGRYPRGKTRTEQFTRAGLVKVYCDIHSHMSAAILVLDHPYFTIPAADGTFEIANVPPGEYTIVGWHERVGERLAPVRVHSGRTTAVDLTVPVEDMP